MKTFKILNNFIYHNNLIKKNDKIVLAVSGGIDSLVMAHFLKKYCDKRKHNIYLEAVYIKIDEVSLNYDRLDYLKDFFKKIDMNFKIIGGKIFQNVDFHCYTCSRERRKQLCTYAIENGFDSIAYGHILDDYLETGLMNMITHGHLESMLPFYTMFDNKIQVIRPLLRFPKKEIFRYARDNQIENGKHKCDFEANNIRDKARELIKIQKKIHKKYEHNLRKIINRWNDLKI